MVPRSNVTSPHIVAGSGMFFVSLFTILLAKIRADVSHKSTICGMRSSIAILFVVSIIGVVQGLVLAIALVRTKRGNRTANRLLSGFATTVSLTVLGGCLTKLRWSPILY